MTLCDSVNQALLELAFEKTFYTIILDMSVVIYM